MCGYSVHRSCGLCHLLRYILHSKNSKLYAVERLLLRTFLLQAPIPLKCFIDGSEPVSRDLRGAAEAKGTITKGSIKKHLPAPAVDFESKRRKPGKWSAEDMVKQQPLWSHRA